MSRRPLAAMTTFRPTVVSHLPRILYEVRSVDMMCIAPTRATAGVGYRTARRAAVIEPCKGENPCA